MSLLLNYQFEPKSQFLTEKNLIIKTKTTCMCNLAGFMLPENMMQKQKLPWVNLTIVHDIVFQIGI